VTSKQLFIVVLAAIGTIGVLEGIALLMGVNGALFGLAMTTIGGLGGWSGKKLLDQRRSG